MGGPKQLVKIGKESTLERAVRLIRELGVTDITSISHDNKLTVDGCGLFRPSARRCTAETMLSSCSLWSNRTVILLGDVFFTKPAIHQILRSRRNIGVFGRRGPNQFNGRNHGEIFAIAFDREQKGLIENTTARVIGLFEKGAWGNLWDFYHVIVGLPLWSSDVEDDVFLEIHDLTDDFDSPNDFLSSIAIYERFVFDTESSDSADSIVDHG